MLMHLFNCFDLFTYSTYLNMPRCTLVAGINTVKNENHWINFAGHSNCNTWSANCSSPSSRTCPHKPRFPSFNSCSNNWSSNSNKSSCNKPCSPSCKSRPPPSSPPLRRLTQSLTINLLVTAAAVVVLSPNVSAACPKADLLKASKWVPILTSSTAITHSWRRTRLVPRSNWWAMLLTPEQRSPVSAAASSSVQDVPPLLSRRKSLSMTLGLCATHTILPLEMTIKLVLMPRPPSPRKFPTKLQRPVEKAKSKLLPWTPPHKYHEYLLHPRETKPPRPHNNTRCPLIPYPSPQASPLLSKPAAGPREPRHTPQTRRRFRMRVAFTAVGLTRLPAVAVTSR